MCSLSPLPGVSRKAGELARQPCRLVKAAGRMPSPSRRLAALQAAFPEVPIALPWAGQGEEIWTPLQAVVLVNRAVGFRHN